MQIGKMVVAALATLLWQAPAAAQYPGAAVAFDDARSVDVWLNYSEYRPFEKVEVGFTGPVGSYLLVMRISDDGYQVRGTNTVEILYPRAATARQAVSSGNHDGLSAEFETLGGPGTTGAVFAVASSKPFDLNKVSQRFQWQHRLRPSMWARQDIAGRVLEKLGITPADILGVAVDAYDVVKIYGDRRPLRSHNDFSTNLFRRCYQDSKDQWCDSFKKR